MCIIRPWGKWICSWSTASTRKRQPHDVLTSCGCLPSRKLLYQRTQGSHNGTALLICARSARGHLIRVDPAAEPKPLQKVVGKVARSVGKDHPPGEHAVRPSLFLGGGGIIGPGLFSGQYGRTDILENRNWTESPTQGRMSEKASSRRKQVKW